MVWMQWGDSVASIQVRLWRTGACWVQWWQARRLWRRHDGAGQRQSAGQGPTALHRWLISRFRPGWGLLCVGSLACAARSGSAWTRGRTQQALSPRQEGSCGCTGVVVRMTCLFFSFFCCVCVWQCVFFCFVSNRNERRTKVVRMCAPWWGGREEIKWSTKIKKWAEVPRYFLD